MIVSKTFFYTHMSVRNLLLKFAINSMQKTNKQTKSKLFVVLKKYTPREKIDESFSTDFQDCFVHRSILILFSVTVVLRVRKQFHALLANDQLKLNQLEYKKAKIKSD